MPENEEKKKSFVDSIFEPFEALVGGLEKSKEFSESPVEEKTRVVGRTEFDFPGEVTDAEFTERKPNPALIWGALENGHHHVFEGFTKSSLCGSYFEAGEIKSRKTEMNEGMVICCGSCLRILHSKYRNA